MEHTRGNHADDPSDTEPCHCDENKELSSPLRYHLTSEELREWLKEYDQGYGRWPEHEYEGYSVWRFIEHKLGLTEDDDADFQNMPEEWFNPKPK